MQAFETHRVICLLLGGNGRARHHRRRAALLGPLARVAADPLTAHVVIAP